MKDLTFYTADGYTQILSVEALGQALAGAAFTPVKLGARNEGDEDWLTQISLAANGASDGVGMARIGGDTATLSAPWGVTASLGGSTGVWGATGTKSLVVTAVNASGETVASVEGSAVVTATTQIVSWSWQAVPSAVSYNGYRREGSGSTYATPSKIFAAEVTTSFDDDGTAPASGAPPIENTTAGAGPGYGTPPTMSVGPLTLAGPLEPGQWVFFWLGLVVPSNATDDDNTRFFDVAFA